MIAHNNKLEIFERFETDKNLPKFKAGVEIDLVPSQSPFNSGVGNGFSGSGFINSGNFIISSGTVLGTATGWNGNSVVYVNGNPPEVKKDSWLKKFFAKWKASKAETSAKKKEMKMEKRKTATIVEFFSSLATSLNDMKTMMDIALHYETAITNAEKAGQVALVESLKQRLGPAKTEAQLVSYGLKLYLTEEQVVDFYTKAEKDRHLKLTWIKNFIKPIPTKILDVKEKLDSRYVFDNYVILHYDPNNDATNLTQKEIEERKKDPIIFGLIANSRRLYYVGDWIDDYCNLTLDVVLETLGENASEINNDTVKTFIERGYEKEVRLKRQLPAPATDPTPPPVVEQKKEVKKRPVTIREKDHSEKIKKRKK